MLVAELPAIRLLAHRLSGSGRLVQGDVDALGSIAGPAKVFAKGELLVDQGQRCDTVWLLASGWSFRQKMLLDGRRQITAIMFPGELTEKGPAMPFGSGDAIVAAQSVSAHPIARDRLNNLLDTHPNLMRSFLYEELTRHAVTREWVLLLGKRSAEERLAYFFYETYARLNAMGVIEGNVFDVPLSQQDIADIVGLSAVHLNRTMQQLRAAGLLSTEGHKVVLSDPPALARLAAFNKEMVRIAEEFSDRAREGQSPGAT